MKKYCVALLLIPIIAAAESKGKSLVGRWHWTDRDNSSEMTFHKDGTFSSDVHIGSVSTSSKGKWWVKGDTLHYKYTSDSSYMIEPGTHDQDKLLEVTNDHFTIRTQKTGVRTYKRVKER